MRLRAARTYSPMTPVTVKPGRFSDINRIANRMREVDRLECAAVGHTPKQALVEGLRSSTLCWTAWRGDRPVAMFGVAPISMIEGRGAAWFLGTDEVWLGARHLIRWGPAFVDGMQRQFPTLENAVAADNAPAIRLLTRLGFVLEDEVMVVGDLPMRRFSRGR